MSRALWLLAVVALLGSAAPTSPQILGGIALGSNVTDAVKMLGFPEVVNTDVGHVWSWHDAKTGGNLRVTTDDDGVVQIVDFASPQDNPQPIQATVGTNVASFKFGDERSAEPSFLGNPLSVADGPLPDSGNAAQYLRFAGAPPAELVLAYAATPGNGPLREIFLGTFDALADAGLIPDKGADDALYRAPLLNSIGSADYNGPKSGVAYTRIVVNSDGTIGKATIFISTGDETLDRVALAIANGCTFDPATSRGRPTTGVYFRRENFLVNS